MKKFFVMLATAMMATVSMNAQKEYLKHEVAVSYGAMSNSTWMSIGDAIGTTIISLGSVRYDDGSITGPIALEYFYHLNPVVGVGAVGIYTQEKKDMFIGNEPWGEAKNTFITVLPAVKFNWLHKEYFGIYSKVAAGVSFRTQKEDYSKSDHDNLSKSDVLFNWQLTGIGIEAGSPYIRAFAEFGIGEQGMALAGLRMKF